VGHNRMTLSAIIAGLALLLTAGDAACPILRASEGRGKDFGVRTRPSPTHCFAMNGAPRGALPKVLAKPVTGTKIGQMYPDFLLPSLDGGFGRLSDYRGRKVLLIHFASW
jgi:hypothetical protein